jgi:molybdate transport system permease protein
MPIARHPAERGNTWAWMLGLPLVLFVAVPILALLVSTSPGDLSRALRHPMMGSSLWLSFRTTLLALGLVVLTGTPLSWWLARSGRPWARALETLVELPIVIPPAVVGVALLEAYGRRGLLGPGLAELGLSLPFTTAAVVAAQIVVAAPFYIQSATAGFRKVDDDLLLVAETLGAPPGRAFLRVALPTTLPAMMAGAALCWARALGEFGATLFFAGNLMGRTQTMPLAIYSALEVDLGLARALALVLGGSAFGILLLLRLAPLVTRGGRTGTREERSPA